MKTSAGKMAEVPPGVTTVISTAPAPAGETTVIELAESELMAPGP